MLLRSVFLRIGILLLERKSAWCLRAAVSLYGKGIIPVVSSIRKPGLYPLRMSRNAPPFTKCFPDPPYIEGQLFKGISFLLDGEGIYIVNELDLVRHAFFLVSPEEILQKGIKLPYVAVLRYKIIGLPAFRARRRSQCAGIPAHDPDIFAPRFFVERLC